MSASSSTITIRAMRFPPVSQRFRVRAYPHRNSPRGQTTGTTTVGARPSSLPGAVGVVFWICIRNSTLVWVFFISLEQQLERLLAVQRGEHAAQLPDDRQLLRRQQDLLLAGARTASTSTAGKIRLSASLRSQLELHVAGALELLEDHLSIVEPVSTSAVARMVSEPPFSMLRAAPKNRLGGYSAVESTPPDRMRPLAGAARL